MNAVRERVEHATWWRAHLSARCRRLANPDAADRLIAPSRIMVIDIQHAVSAYYGISLHDMISAQKSANVVRPRQVAIYLAKELTSRSLAEIGRRFGGRDHSTVLHAVKRIKDLRTRDPDIDREVTTIRRIIEGPKL